MMDRLINLYTKRTAIGVTIAFNYWNQYHRRDGQSLQILPNSGSNHRYLLRSVQLGDPSTSKPNPNPKPEAFTDDWFIPFVSVKPALRVLASNPGAHTDTHHIGSGFICHPLGFVITCFGAAQQPSNAIYLVRLGNGREVLARQAFVALALNIGLLKLDDTAREGPDWPYAELGNPNLMKMDDRVYSVGTTRCPLHNQVTDGTLYLPAVSGQGLYQIKLLEPLMSGISKQNFIQHTVLLNPNDTGAPLVNIGGKVVGITIVTCGPNDHFAVPVTSSIINYLFNIVNSYVYEKSGPPLGLTVYLLDKQLRERLENNTDFQGRLRSELNGILVWDVTQVFKLNIYELKRFDVITHINGAAVQSMDELYWAVRALRAGQRVTFSVNRPNSVFHMQPNAHLLAKLSACKTRLV